MAIEVAPGLLVIETQIANGKAAVIAGTDVALAVDAGLDDSEGRAVRAAADSLDRDSVKLAYTHAHADHALGGTAFADCEILATRAVSDHIADQSDAWAEKRGETREDLASRLGWPTREITDGFVIDLGGSRVSCIEAPGHAPGAICLYAVERRVLFGGDTIVTNIPPAFRDGDSATLERTLRRLGQLEIDILVPGHGQIVVGPRAARSAIEWSADYLARCRVHVEAHQDDDVDLIIATAPYEGFVGGQLDRDLHRNTWRHEQTLRQMVAEQR